MNLPSKSPGQRALEFARTRSDDLENIRQLVKRRPTDFELAMVVAPILMDYAQAMEQLADHCQSIVQEAAMWKPPAPVLLCQDCPRRAELQDFIGKAKP